MDVVGFGVIYQESLSEGPFWSVTIVDLICHQFPRLVVPLILCPIAIGPLAFRTQVSNEIYNLFINPFRL